MSTTNEDLVQVPRRLLVELASYLEPAHESTVSVHLNGEWTQTMINQLRPEISKYKGAVAALDYAAKHAGAIVTLDEIQASCGIANKQIGADLGAMSKAAKRLFNKKVWPMRAMQTNAGMNYLMQPEIAEWWLQ